MPKIFTYRGRTLDELKKMSIEEFSKLVNARERRALKRGLTEGQKTLLGDIRKEPGKFHKTHARDMVILPEMVGVKLGVHNGKEWVAIDIAPRMIGMRVGDFSISTKHVKHSAPGVGASKGTKFYAVK